MRKTIESSTDKPKTHLREGASLMPKIIKQRGRIVYTMLMIVTLVAMMMGIVAYMHSHSEKEALERLRLETVKLKSSINIQMESDMETLRAMASLVSERYTDEKSYEHICKTFEPFGFCENIGILTPDNYLITKAATIDVSDKMQFSDESRRGEYISNRIHDVTNAEREVIRSAVPITAPDGQVIAVMYGTIDSEKMAERYRHQVESINAYMCIVDRKTGQFIMDTKSERVSNITNLATIKYKDGYSYDKLVKELSDGKAGNTSFVEHKSDEFLYVRYSSLDVGDWCIMLAQPESVVFAGAKKTASFLIGISALIMLIMLIYIICMMHSINKMLKMNSYAADIRKHLLEMNQRSDSLREALKLLTEFAEARSTFVMDVTGEAHYIKEEYKDVKLNPEEIQWFNNMLLLYVARRNHVSGITLYTSRISLMEPAKDDMPDLYEFMRNHQINQVDYVVVVSDTGNVYILGTLNAANNSTAELLRKVAVCFSMTVYNNKHLKHTEQLALTDSLTKTANRMAFNEYIKDKVFAGDENACIYIDVNELHYFNNKYGHAVGDHMLIFIAQCLSTHFSDSVVYRMGGDEFFTEGIPKTVIEARLDVARSEIEEMKYHIAVGIQYGRVETDIEEMVNAAEKMMYDEKAKYYQDKELSKIKGISKDDSIVMETGIKEIDACLSVMTLRYLAVYCVALDKDTCLRVLAPSYFKEIVDENNLFSSSIKGYIHDFVKPEHQRALLSFLDYDVLRKQLADRHMPSLKYERIDGEKVKLTIYPIQSETSADDCVWIFERA